MGAIQFFSTPKGDLTHYSYMFRKLEPLGTDTKNMDCSRLVTMLHLEIKKGEDDMKTSDVQKYLKETAFCMKRLKKRILKVVIN